MKKEYWFVGWENEEEDARKCGEGGGGGGGSEEMEWTETGDKDHTKSRP